VLRCTAGETVRSWTADHRLLGVLKVAGASVDMINVKLASWVGDAWVMWPGDGPWLVPDDAVLAAMLATGHTAVHVVCKAWCGSRWGAHGSREDPVTVQSSKPYHGGVPASGIHRGGGLATAGAPFAEVPCRSNYRTKASCGTEARDITSAETASVWCGWVSIWLQD
jgi:hypothetical protein